MSFGDNLKEYRLSKGWTQKKLAEKLDLSRSYTSELEANKRNPSLETIQKIAKKLEVSTYFLLEGEKTFSDYDIHTEDGELTSWSSSEFSNTIRNSTKDIVIEKLSFFNINNYSHYDLILLMYTLKFIDSKKDYNSDEFSSLMGNVIDATRLMVSSEDRDKENIDLEKIQKFNLHLIDELQKHIKNF